ncbi:hypothetical protein SELMODRAFT_419382 [Selaginella moellendorffii]|uniref:Uncharacterized protein n=1 Tax=Selaginella moellendorffii TaxID=88036 RepID=D8S8S0_SELML|nr:hypothetical protein SELMODRAFT_419382 [Selaginella moellendorffii]
METKSRKRQSLSIGSTSDNTQVTQQALTPFHEALINISIPKQCFKTPNSSTRNPNLTLTQIETLEANHINPYEELQFVNDWDGCDNLIDDLLKQSKRVLSDFEVPNIQTYILPLVDEESIRCFLHPYFGLSSIGAQEYFLRTSNTNLNLGWTIISEQSMGYTFYLKPDFGLFTQRINARSNFTHFVPGYSIAEGKIFKNIAHDENTSLSYLFEASRGYNINDKHIKMTEAFYALSLLSVT